MPQVFDHVLQTIQYMTLRALATNPAALPLAYAGQLPALVSLGLATETGSLTAEGWAALASQPLASQAPTRRAVKWRQGRTDLRTEYSGRTGFTGNRRRGVS